MTALEAVPAIREALVRRVHAASGAGSDAERRHHADVATGLTTALRILTDAADTTPALGIADRASLPAGAEAQTRAWLGEDADALLGSAQEVAVAEQPERGVQPGTEEGLPRPVEGRDVHDL